MSSIRERMLDKHCIKDISLDTPVTIAKLELTGICNLNCSFCYNSKLRKNHIRQKLVTDNDVYKFLDAIKTFPSIKEVGLYGLGESTLHPSLDKYYKLIKDAGYYTYLTTNGVYIDHLVSALPYIDSLKFSWNYKNDEDFAIKTHTDHSIMYTIMNNINRIYKLKPDISISVVLGLDDEISEYKYMLSKLSYKDIVFVPLLSQGWNSSSSTGGGPRIIQEPNTIDPCWSLFKGIYVDCDLNVRTCSYGNCNNTHILGSLKHNPLDAILYNRDKYKQMHLDREFPSMCKKCLKLE